jgi:hypothetical protein
MGGHFGQKATYQRVKRMFYWKGIKHHVETFIQQYSVCQQAKHLTTKPAGLLQPLPIPKDVWLDISLDFIEGLL